MFASKRADVAELVDAQVSEACCRKAVEVRFFSSAPIYGRSPHFSKGDTNNAKLGEPMLNVPPLLTCGLPHFVNMRNEFILSIVSNQRAFGLDLSDGSIKRLADYYELIQEHNPILHLVGPCSPEEFAVRHILESLTLLEHLPKNAKLADIGTGAGLPSIPCLLVRDDLHAVLIESKEKKTKFLELAVEKLEVSKRAKIVCKQFQEADPTGCEAVVCRALDKFTERLPRLLKWSMRRKLLLFGGENLKAALQENKRVFDQTLMPMSEQRFLFVVSGT